MSYRSKDLTGQRFTRLLVVSREDRDANGCALFKCRCDCGGEVVRRGAHLRTGAVKSCGCLHDTHGTGNKYSVTHGHARTPTYKSWMAMHDRCRRVEHSAFRRYGWRGIVVCDRWIKFENFLKDMGERPPGMSIERKDNNGNYCPENCRWATKKEQARNTSSNRMLLHDGQIHCVTEWSEITGIKTTTIRERLRRGWSISRTLGADI
jgi:hypothetical protein